jgi:drug/metabolite transporter (DMT)-like permease
MMYLILASFAWAFSFGIIKAQLVSVHPGLVACVRLGLAALIFLPFLRLKTLRFKIVLQLAAIGAVQYGVMYLAYLNAFRFLSASEIALFTVTTPIFVVLIDNALAKSFRTRIVILAIVSAIAALLVVFKGSLPAFAIMGVALVQLSNIAFAIGQVWYRRILSAESCVGDAQVFALLYFSGGLLAAVTLLWGAPFAQLLLLNGKQVAALAYLSVVPTGLAFFLWNKGARQVSVGTLAVLNNLKVPLAVLVSLIAFEVEPSFERVVRLSVALLLLGVAAKFSKKQLVDAFVWEIRHFSV